MKKIILGLLLIGTMTQASEPKPLYDILKDTKISNIKKDIAKLEGDVMKYEEYEKQGKNTNTLINNEFMLKYLNADIQYKKNSLNTIIGAN